MIHSRVLGFGLAAGALFLASLSPAAQPQQQTRAAAVDASGASQWELLETYCVRCHNTKTRTAGVAFDSLKPEDVTREAELFEKVARKLRGRLMPPAGQPRPTEARYDSFVTWLEGTIDRAAPEPHPGRVVLHRLNRKEYANAIQDLFALKIDPAEILPEDDQSEGFDNIAVALHTSPTFFGQYVAAARSVAVQVVGKPNPGPGSQAYFMPVEGEGKQAFHVDGLPLGTRGGFAADHYFPADGEYEVNIQNLFPGDAYFLGSEHASHLVVTLDGVKIYQTTVGGGEDLKAIDQDQSPAIDAMNKRLKGIRFKTTAGTHQVAVTFLARTFAESDSELSPLAPGGGMDRLIRITGFEVRGPFNPTGLSTTPSRQRLFTCQPAPGAPAAEEDRCAREILSTVARRAYRRPVNDADLASIVDFYRSARDTGGFEEGIRAGLTRILASPYFLYRASVPDSPDTPPGAVYRVSDLELASRLAFFLWSSIPDDELLDLAQAGKLHEEPVLEKQVQRMLADPRARVLARNFAYQWLQIGSIRAIDPDPNVFPFAANHRTVVGVDGDLRGDMTEEVLLFIDSVFREDRNAIDLLTADYTFLNERVALHYGIGDIKGNRFRRVILENSARHGLLGKAAVLMVSSYPNRTSPVRRGAWILENLLGTPPAAPPPDVEALLSDNAVGTRSFRTVRERLEAHRQQPRCNACHGVLDPLGFALENFDAVGAWRTTETFATTPVDATGELPDGTRLTGPDDLRAALLRRPDQFVQTLTQKLMMYALGRNIEYRDMPAVRAIVRDAAKENNRFSSIVMGIVQSDAFQKAQVAGE